MLKFFTQQQKAQIQPSMFSKYVGSTNTTELLKAVKFLNLKLKVVHNKLPLGNRNNCTYDFNCWNFTAWLKGWTKQVCWYDYTEMTAHLRKLSQTKQPKLGDVVAWFSWGELIHTAIILEIDTRGNHIVIQKSGPQPMIIERIKDTNYSTKAQYRFYTA